MMEARAIGVMRMRDEKGLDDKIIAVSVKDPAFADYTDHAQLPGHLLREIRRFFEDYKTLENKQVVVEDFMGPPDAIRIVQDALEHVPEAAARRAEQGLNNPHFRGVRFWDGRSHARTEPPPSGWPTEPNPLKIRQLQAVSTVAQSLRRQPRILPPPRRWSHPTSWILHVPASVLKKKKIRRAVVAAAAIIVVALVTVVLAQLKPAAPTVERGTTWRETVKRGEMIRQTRGPGTLVPEDIRWITAETDATVQRIVTLPSAKMLTPETVILELRDEKVQQELVDAELQLRAAQADLTSLKVRLNNELLQQQSDTANIRGQYHQAKIQAEANEQLSKEGLLSKVTTRVSQVKRRSSRSAALEEERLKIKAESTRAQVNAEQARVAQRQALYDLKRSQADALKVRAGIDGVLQVVPGAGRPARAVGHQPRARRRARPSQGRAPHPGDPGRDIEIGQIATVDTRNGEVQAASPVSTRPRRTAPSSWTSLSPAAASRRPAGPERRRHRGTRAAG